MILAVIDMAVERFEVHFICNVIHSLHVAHFTTASLTLIDNQTAVDTKKVNVLLPLI